MNNGVNCRPATCRLARNAVFPFSFFPSSHGKQFPVCCRASDSFPAVGTANAMKKRKNSQIDPNHPFPHTLTRPPFHAAPTSQTKGADTDPKTSEYAFFKKLKKDASGRVRSRPLQKDYCLSSKKPESSYYSTEKIVDAKGGSKGYNSSRIIEDVSTGRTGLFLPTSDGARNNSGLYSNSNTPKVSRGWGDNFKPQCIFSHEGNRYAHGEVFSRKREKLRQCVADALFTNKEKLCSKGHDIISMLLSRLFPVNIEENKYEDTNPGKEVNATRYDLLDSQESDVQFKERYQMPKRKLLELESSPYFSDAMLSPMFLRSDERITPHAEFPTYHSCNFWPPQGIAEPECKRSASTSFGATANSVITLGSLFNEAGNATGYGSLDLQELDVQFTKHHQISERTLLELESSSYFSDHMLSPMYLQSLEIITPHANFPTHPHKILPLLSITEAESELGGTPSFIDKSDLTRGFLCNEQKHEVFTLNHFKELGKLDREPVPLLLEKDFDCTTDETNLPIIYKYPKPDRAPELLILGHGEEQILNNTLDEYHLTPSSSLLGKPQDFNSILDSGLFRYQEFRFGKYVYEDMDSNFNHTALSLSHNKHYFKLSENCKSVTSCVQDSIYLSPYQHRVRTVSNDYHHHPDSEAWLRSSLDECQRCLSLTSSHPNYRSSNSRNLQLPQRESVSSLFHINDNYEPENDGGNSGEMLYHFRKSLIEIYSSSFLGMSMQRDHRCSFPLDGSDHINEQERTQKMLL
ncbi:hypothetical protein VNO77_16309 [Canavalia gladiata]|uniref:Uncharacterized protein n=1 Tax=Canavalia gladiata TaxID=3824 RepID=A0AAN9M3V7_CANGL